MKLCLIAFFLVRSSFFNRPFVQEYLYSLTIVQDRIQYIYVFLEPADNDLKVYSIASSQRNAKNKKLFILLLKSINNIKNIKLYL